MSAHLKVWSFDKVLTNKDKEDLLMHFGAVSVKHIGRSGRDVSVLASFKNETDCEYAMHKLHQLKLLGVRLMAAYCDSSPHLCSEQPHRSQESNTKVDTSLREKTEKKIKQLESRLCAVGTKLGVNHPIPPNLRYLYPPPSPSIIANITQTLVAVPKFYTQVLHLMNKMNLPTPFGSLFEIPPIFEEVLKLIGYFEKKAGTENGSNEVNNTDDLGIVGEEEGSAHHETTESESELESDGDTNTIRMKMTPLPGKRKIKPKNTINKKPKLSQLQQTCVPHQRTSEPSSVMDVFETRESHEPRKLQLNLQGTILPQKKVEAEGITFQAGGFGKIESSHYSADGKKKDEASMEEWKEPSTYITKEELLSNMVTKADWPILPVFKNYNPGAPSTKIYIKNLAKTTTEDDLKHIYGRYIFWLNEEEASLFSIRVMKEGRMKGQAFVTFPSEKKASEALEDTNGYILNDKPMVVVFGKVKST